MTDHQHPDADQLSAFAEHALPAHEYQQTLAHLAVCPACRRIVDLSLPPAPEPLAHPATKPRVPRWTILWPATAALAALLLVAFTLHLHHHATTPTQTAAAPPIPPTPVPPTARSSAPHTPKPAQHRPSHEPIAAAAPAPPPQPSPASQSQAVEVSAASPAISTTDAVSQATVTLNQSVNSPVAAGQPANRTSLPSHLPTLSVAANGQQIVAIDTRNTLFLSNDGGRQWKRIPTQWPGHVIRVDLALPVMSRAFTARAAAGSVTATSSITGTVTDAAGAVIQGATIVLSAPATNTTRSAATDNTGRYLAGNLPPGTYTVEASAPGFRTQTLAAIPVTPNTTAETNLKLSVGSVSQAVMVQGAPLADARPAAPSKTPGIQPQSPTVFEITTDSGEHWISSDGQTWKPR